MTTINICDILLPDYEPSKEDEKLKKDEQSLDVLSKDEKIKHLTERCSNIEHNQTLIIKEIANLKKEFAILLQKSKDEYIAALQCEMEITRHYLIKEIYKKEFSYAKGNHGDPLYNF